MNVKAAQNIGIATRVAVSWTHWEKVVPAARVVKMNSEECLRVAAVARMNVCMRREVIMQECGLGFSFMECISVHSLVQQ